ncbi:MAG: hypothetical protein HY840_00330 [Bacteroidetes bacterium]|nr:hypothetical protein [Bacteroidota bacterium]
MQRFLFLKTFQKNILSKICLLLIVFYWVFSFYNYDRAKKNPIVWDVVSFYGYLPAVFIYHDITLHFPDKDPGFFAFKYWPEHAPNGGRVIKTTMGVSYLYAPFFFLGHIYAGISGEPQDGYSFPYQLFLQIGTLFYVILGFIFLRKLLLLYFSDAVIALTILSVFFGTNLLYYSTGGALMAHAYLFAVLCVYLFAIDTWHQKPDFKMSILLGLTGGLLTLMKPTMIICILIPLLYGIRNLKLYREKLQFLLINKWQLLIVIIFFLLPGIPQLIYWKYITGNWFYFSYTGESFFFENPHIIQGWFGYRNGWLLYTPIMIFALAGFFFMKEKVKDMKLSILLFFAFMVYIIHSWWCWWFGGFGLRAYVELYGALAIPMAAFYDFFLRKKLLFKIPIIIISFLLIALNIFQEFQFEHVGLHFDSMTKKSYWISFLKTEVPGEWWNSLQIPNTERAKNGLSEFYEDKKNIYDITQEYDFENVPYNNDSIYYSTIAARGSKHSYVLKDQKAFSPAISMQASDILRGNAREAIASVQFFLPENISANETHMLVILLKSDTGVYFFRAINMNSVYPDPRKWSTIAVTLPLDTIRDWRDIFETYVWNNNTQKEIFIDNLRFEIIRGKE